MGRNQSQLEEICDFFEIQDRLCRMSEEAGGEEVEIESRESALIFEVVLSRQVGPMKEVLTHGETYNDMTAMTIQDGEAKETLGEDQAWVDHIRVSVSRTADESTWISITGQFFKKHEDQSQSAILRAIFRPAVWYEQVLEEPTLWIKPEEDPRERKQEFVDVLDQVYADYQKAKEE